MTALADKLRATTKRLIERLGVSVTYYLPPEYDATEGDVSDDETTKRVKISPPERWLKYPLSDTSAEDLEDLRVTLPHYGQWVAGSLRPLTFAPAKGHALIWHDERYTVVDVGVIAADETPVAYELRLRRGGGV